MAMSMGNYMDRGPYWVTVHGVAIKSGMTVTTEQQQASPGHMDQPPCQTG